MRAIWSRLEAADKWLTSCPAFDAVMDGLCEEDAALPPMLLRLELLLLASC